MINPIDCAMRVLKNAADYDVDMSNPVSIESWNEPKTPCYKCGQYGANMRMTYNNKFGTDEQVRHVCKTCYQSS